MTDELAERLLATVLSWGPEEIRINLPIVQALAAWKYDAYKQFGHGMRFVESLALWLEQFETLEERKTAFEFVRRRLVCLSEAEMTHLVEMAYPDFIRPYLLKRVASEVGQPVRQSNELATTQEFLVRQRQCLFLGLSDGARTDVFRRSNSCDLTYEQFLLSYEIERGRAKKLLASLHKGLRQITAAKVSRDMVKFRTAVLLDDFSASGLSYLRTDQGEPTGKIARFFRNLFGPTGLNGRIAHLCKNLWRGNPTANLFDRSNLEILVVLYAGTIHAHNYLKEEMSKLAERHRIRCEVFFVHLLDGALCIVPDQPDSMTPLIERYYDPSIEDEHTSVGGANVKYGFAQCGLPLALPHNTPNNSLALLWAETEKVRALFPRVQRHKKQA